MRAMNRRLNLPNLQNIMREFERQNERMEMTSEMMGDAVDDALQVRACVFVGFQTRISKDSTKRQDKTLNGCF
jgi:hypothetical protein